jgi:GDPmannose 4,6-dehydratase
MKKAFITGISGQDGSYLAEYLLELGYEVYGLVRRVALEDPEHRLSRIVHLRDDLHLFTGSLESNACLFHILQKVQPHECYHLAAKSFVSYSFENEFSTMRTNIEGTHHLLSALHSLVPDCRFYFSGSSEMFGSAEETPQNENTRFRPRSIYGISKLAGYELTRNYRESYGMFACGGFLYNHESPRRGLEYVTRKITSAAVRIRLGLQNTLHLGNLQARRDWGFAGDYVKAMHAMLNQDQPDDYVIATGVAHSVEEFLEAAFAEVNLDYRNYLEIDDVVFRAETSETLVGDAGKAQRKLGWIPTVSFEELVSMMVKADLEKYSAKPSECVTMEF